MWHALEPIHAVSYFAPECHERYAALGLKGFWMGYFASRSAPFGEASPELVTATFFGFAPAMVARALPDAWELATPADVLDARLAGSVAALRRMLVPDHLDLGDTVEALELAEVALDACSPAGRPLFAALRALPAPVDPLARLWHVATLLREHRGDGHVAANLAHGLDGITTHVTFAAADGPVERATLQPHRGWSNVDWFAGEIELVERGWLRPDGTLTDTGRSGRQAVEALTDDLAAVPWRALGPDGTARFHEIVAPLARAIAAAGGIPAVNPMGVPTDI